MNFWEFLLILIGLLIIGLWGTMIIAAKTGLLDKEEEPEKPKKKTTKVEKEKKEDKKDNE